MDSFGQLKSTRTALTYMCFDMVGQRWCHKMEVCKEEVAAKLNM